MLSSVRNASKVIPHDLPRNKPRKKTILLHILIYSVHAKPKRGVNMTEYRNWKPLIDFVCALLLLLLVSPILLVISLLIKMEDPSGPVIFCQERAGKGNRIFTLYKLRSMKTVTEQEARTIPDEDRILQIGKFVRKTSLDELPQLWNILKGDMSFIGPRPLLPEYLPYYNEVEKKRHDVKPGISGWAQVNGRNRVTWEERFLLDVEYVEQLNVWLDIKIVFMTLKKVFMSSDVIVAGKETNQYFSDYRMAQWNDHEKRDLYG